MLIFRFSNLELILSVKLFHRKFQILFEPAKYHTLATFVKEIIEKIKTHLVNNKVKKQRSYGKVDS